MEFKWRAFWFGRNLSAFILALIFLPLRWSHDIIRIVLTLFITNGSETIAFPWNWDWRLKD